MSRHVRFCDEITQRPCRIPCTNRAASKLGDATFGRAAQNVQIRAHYR